MFDWSDLRIFLAVSAAGSFTAASTQLRMDQTTVGRRVTALEASLGAKLFRRGRDGLTLTAAGKDVLVFARQMDEAAVALDRGVRGRDQEASGTVRITAVESFASRFLAPRVPAFRRAHPGVRLEVLGNTRVESLSRREADVAVRLARPEQAGLVAKKAGAVGYGLYASRSYVAQRGNTADLGAHDVLAFDESLSFVPEARWLEEQRPPSVVLRTNSLAVLEQAAKGGAGVAVLPCYIGDPDPLLVRLLGPRDVVTREAWLVVHGEIQSRADVRAVMDFVAKEMARAKVILSGKP